MRAATVFLIVAGGSALALARPASASAARVTSLVSAAGGGANGSGQFQSFAGASSDGTRVFFRTAESLVGADTDGWFDVYERSGGQTTLVSAPGAGGTSDYFGGAHASFAGASSDGARVFFRTVESLVGADTDFAGEDVYERSGGQTTLVSVPGTGASSSSEGAFFAGTSSDGTRVFFTTEASLVGADVDGLRDVYERSGGETTLVSVPGPGASGSAGVASFGGVSSDGSLVFFHTAENLVGADSDGLFDTYERSGGQTTLVSAAGAGASGSSGSAFFARASSDGTRVFFVTEGNLVGADTDGLRDVYERSGGETTFVSGGGTGASGSAQGVDFAGASSDGTRVFFETAENLVEADADGLFDVYERSGGETTLVSAPGSGASSFALRASFAGASSDGTRVFFTTVEWPVGSEGAVDVDVYERSGGETTLVSEPGAGASGISQGASFAGASSDGARVFFATEEGLVGADTDGLQDIYQRSGGQTTLVSEPGAGASGSAAHSHFGGASGDGARVFFVTLESLVGADTDGLQDVYESTLTNTPPTLDPTDDQTVDEGQQLQFTISATDPDGDALAYSASNLPSGATFDAATRTFSWTPGFDQAGSYQNVHFEVSDGALAHSEKITITVSDVAGGGSDTTAPQTAIDSGPKRVTKPRAKFRFSSSEPGSSFECRLDNHPFKPCASPKKLKHLKNGKHRFLVRAIDAAGNADPSAAKRRFRVNLPG